MAKKKITYLTKAELDKMTYAKVKNYKEKIYLEMPNDNKFVRYLMELEIYAMIRFKAEVSKTINNSLEWYNKTTDRSDFTSQLPVVDSLVKKHGLDAVFYMNIQQGLLMLGELEMIQGIEINIPNEYKGIKMF
jgi:hypothetical protein